jgi:hypothetical protein
MDWKAKSNTQSTGKPTDNDDQTVKDIHFSLVLSRPGLKYLVVVRWKIVCRFFLWFHSDLRLHLLSQDLQLARYQVHFGPCSLNFWFLVNTGFHYFMFSYTECVNENVGRLWPRFTIAISCFEPGPQKPNLDIFITSCSLLWIWWYCFKFFHEI